MVFQVGKAFAVAFILLATIMVAPAAAFVEQQGSETEPPGDESETLQPAQDADTDNSEAPSAKADDEEEEAEEEETAEVDEPLPAEEALGGEAVAEKSEDELVFEDQVFDLEPIVVEANTPISSYEQEIISSKDASRTQRTASVDGLFKDVAGVQLSRRSFAGSDSNKVRLRGLEESRSLILLNGRSLHGAGVQGGYYVDWSSLSLEEVERVEIIRGAGPAKYGNTLGGVINIVTRQGSEDFRTGLRVAGGTLGTWNAEGSHAGGIGRLRYSLAASRYETDGYLRNAYADRNAVAARLGLLLPLQMELDGGARFTSSENGMIVYNRPDSPNFDTRKPQSLESQLGGPYVGFLNHGAGQWGPLDWGDGSYWRDRRLQLDLGLSRKAEDFSFSLQGHLFDQNRTEHFYAMDDPRNLALRRDTKPEDWNGGWRADLSNAFQVGGMHQIEYGAQGNYLGRGDTNITAVDAAYFPENRLPTDSKGARNITRRHGAYVQYTWHFHDLLEAGAGLRFDNFHADGPEDNAPTLDENTWSPRAAVVVRPWKGGHIAGRYARAIRFPTVPEYYWWYSGFQPETRSGLTSEKANQWELEVGQEAFESLEVMARGYYYAIDDYVRTIFGYRPSRVVYNIDRVDLMGLEFEISYRLPFGLGAFGNYTFQKSKKQGDILDNSSELTDELVELPENRINVGLDYRHEGGMEARLGVRYVGRRQAVRGDLTAAGQSSLEDLDSYVDMDVNATYPLITGEQGEEGRLFVSLENLLNKHYEEEYGYPMPGITFMSGLDLKF